MVNRNSYRLCALSVFASSLVTLIPPRVHLLTAQENFMAGAHLASIVLGFLSLYVSLQLLKRKRRAFMLAFISLFCLAVLNILQGHHPWHVIIYMVTLITLTRFADVFTVKSSNLNTSRALFASLWLFVAAIIYGALGFYFMNKHAFNVDFTLIQSVKYSFLQLVSFENAVITPTSRYGHFFLLSLDVISLLIVIITASNLFKPVRFALFTAKDDRELALKIITAKSSSVEDFFKLWPQDKHYFFNKSKSAFIAYKVRSGTALVLDGPSGNRRTFSSLIKDFILFSNNNGWSVAIIHADTETVKLGTKIGLRSVFVGNEALIDISEFCSNTIRSKHFRYVHNKAKREELVFKQWEAPLQDDQIEALRKVSDSWLAMPGRREYTFVMGYFDAEYLRISDAAVLKQGDSVVAYVNIIPSYISTERSIDHMRHTSEMPSVGMHFLLSSLLCDLSEKGVKRFNLGLSPLSGVGELSDPNAIERLLASLKSFGSRYYSFSGLEQFKNKFRPDWQPRYILYQGTSASLIRVSNSLSKATALDSGSRVKRWALTVLSLLAGLGYMSFLFAYPLHLDDSSLASELGSKGAPYNWLFNGLDVAVGLVVLYISYVGLVGAQRRLAKIKYGLFGLGGFFNALAAVTPLGSLAGAYHISLSSSFLHGLFSAISIVGFFGAAALYCHLVDRFRLINWCLLVLLMVSTLLSVLLIESSVDGYIQRFQLGIIGVFIALIGFSTSRRAP